jgi:hypothetical protein
MEHCILSRRVEQAFLPAGSGDIPVARFTGQESPVNPQTGMSALLDKGERQTSPFFSSSNRVRYTPKLLMQAHLRHKFKASGTFGGNK